MVIPAGALRLVGHAGDLGGLVAAHALLPRPDGEYPSPEVETGKLLAAAGDVLAGLGVQVQPQPVEAPDFRQGEAQKSAVLPDGRAEARAIGGDEIQIRRIAVPAGADEARRFPARYPVGNTEIPPVHRYVFRSPADKQGG